MAGRDMAVPGEWSYTPTSPHLFGDEGPWTWEVPTLFRGLTDPEGPWAPPAAPRLGADDLAKQIAYWAPLLTLTYGVLGWVRPEVGVRRWLDAGRPADGPALRVCDRWWGASAAALVAWSQTSQQLDHYSRVIAEQTGSLMSPEIPSPRVEPDRTMAAVVEGGSDPLHLGHVLDHLLGGPEFGGLPPQKGRIIRAPASGPTREASLLLDRYPGWYGTLARLGAQLPARPDGRSWQVHVTAAPLGYLGTYRRSTVTGRWFTGRHKLHVLGWTG